ncbi:hypothetical protein [Succinivibrio dextrinosolvens]|uniref:hypothetical protein n=1 Tax=Succinivibrio dextrinosolvens TaxID=83771 RepID=UPI00241C488C|nr:hypothetical protein [Succinivibrio dextrinosolvens]MBE6422034.1 hypothetical protein [Succinivibrio dextrinosolvens]
MGGIGRFPILSRLAPVVCYFLTFYCLIAILIGLLFLPLVAENKSIRFIFVTIFITFVDFSTIAYLCFIQKTSNQKLNQRSIRWWNPIPVFYFVKYSLATLIMILFFSVVMKYLSISKRAIAPIFFISLFSLSFIRTILLFFLCSSLLEKTPNNFKQAIYSHVKKLLYISGKVILLYICSIFIFVMLNRYFLQEPLFKYLYAFAFITSGLCINLYQSSFLYGITK